MGAEFSELTSYDAVPYSSHPYPHSHPRNLAALATLFGISTPDVSTCRVLEIGCASGGNLLPMAASLPDASFVGIDASGRQINDGQQVVDALGLSNITLRHQDLLEFDEGEFDYILCHGVYSWVPDNIQDKILSICRDHLAANGVAFVSYNTYPGWYLRRGVREMMNYHVAGFEDTKTKIEQSRALLRFLTGAVSSDDGAHGMLLHEELQVLNASEDSYLFHEHLEDHNEPLFFHQFMQRANQANLRFLCEAQFASMVTGNLPPEVQETLKTIAPDIIQMEQYLDFLRNRKFRQTLLCHRDVTIDRTVEPAKLLNLFVSSPLSLSAPEEQDLDTEDESIPGEETFEHRGGNTLTVATPVQRAALRLLVDHWPHEVLVTDLADQVWEALPTDQRPSRDECRLEIASTILQCYTSGLANLYSVSSRAVSAISDKPLACSLARYRVAMSPIVTNERHENAQLNDLDRLLLLRLDGSVDQKELTDEILQQVADKKLSLSIDGVDQPDDDRITSAVQASLLRIARSALLIG